MKPHEADTGRDGEGSHYGAAHYEISPDASPAEFLAAARIYAREVVDRYSLSASVSDLEWELSKRAKRRAGAVKHRDGDPESVVLTWEFFESEGWDAMAATIRHELVHVHLLNERDDPGHGEAFRRLAGELDTDVHCDRFADPEWWVTCEECSTRVARYRRSKLVRDPDRYACGECGGGLRVDRND